MNFYHKISLVTIKSIFLRFSLFHTDSHCYTNSEADDAVEQEDWKRQRSESSTAMDEIETTYVPTAMVIDNSAFNGKQVQLVISN